MEWDASLPSDPLPVIDFDADTHSTVASVHAPGNAMEDDVLEPKAVASFKDPDTGALPLSPSRSTPDMQTRESPAPPTLSPPHPNQK
jgi:hypothetical protein